jgi:hypothetical protein
MWLIGRLGVENSTINENTTPQVKKGGLKYRTGKPSKYTLTPRGQTTRTRGYMDSTDNMTGEKALDKE